jgi:hypothetical protein
MSLRTDAFELLATLKDVIKALRRFEHPTGAPYTIDMAERLEPRVTEFEHAIVESRSKDAAVAALDEIDPLMHNINGAATKGDLRIFPAQDDQTPDTYRRLKTIFSESRYAVDSL